MSRETRADERPTGDPGVPGTCGPSCRLAVPGRVCGRSAAPPGPSSCCRCWASARCCNKPSTAWHPACRPNGRSSSAARPTPHRWPASSRLYPRATWWSNRRRRGSGPAIALATALIARHDPTAIVGSFAADHEVSDLPIFDAALRTAVAAADDGWLVTIGLTPTRPETGYGYIERTDDVVACTPEGSAYRAARFVEKPDAATADGVCGLGPLPVEREHVRLASPSAAR